MTSARSGWFVAIASGLYHNLALKADGTVVAWGETATAIKQGVAKASESQENITGAWVMDQSVKVKKGKLAEYTVRMKLTFILK